MPNLDFSPLNAKVPLKEILKGMAGAIFGALLSVVVFGFILYSIITNFTGNISMFVFFGIGAIASFFGQSNIKNQYIRAKNNYLLKKFSERNALEYIPKVSGGLMPSRPGFLLNKGDNRNLTNILRFNQGALLEIGNRNFVVRSAGRNKKDQRYTNGYIVISLENVIPNIILDSKSNNTLGISNLTNLPNYEKLHLEGNFHEYFNLYVPKDYETDALYIFTPDVMEAVLNVAKDYDIEIVANRLYLQTDKPIEFNEQTLKNILQTAEVLIKEIGKQAANYKRFKSKPINNTSGTTSSAAASNEYAHLDAATVQKLQAKKKRASTLTVVMFYIVISMMVSIFLIFGLIFLLALS